MKLNRKWLLIIALVLSMTMAISGTLAYLTDRDTATNAFTLGDVKITVDENFTQNTPIKPGKPVVKEARLQNTGANAAWVWMDVSVDAKLKDYVTLSWNNVTPVSDEPEIKEGKAVWTVLVNNPLPSGAYTDYLLSAVTLSPLVDYQGGEYVVVESGTSKKLEGIVDGDLVVTVDGYAVQVNGFDSVQQARRAYQKQWGDEVSEIQDDRAVYNGTTYANIYEAVAAANANGGGTITLLGSTKLDKQLDVGASITIDGNGHTLRRADGYAGTMFSLGANADLTLNEVIMDGAGATATGNLIAAGGNNEIVLNEGTVLKNNNGAHAVHLGMRIGATLTLNGAEISNNSSDSGAIWGGGHIIVNEGSKINNNSSTGIGGAIRMVSNCNFTMNGGEMCGNKAAGDGGVFWGYGSSTYNFNGGKISGNESAKTGGVLYTGNYSVINISGDFEMCDNRAANSGAIRLTDHTSLTMTGGKISGNTQNGASNAFNTWNNTMSITGGSITDDFSYVGGLGLTIGKADIDGVISYNLSTNHNTAYLAADFKGFKFIVEEGSNFANFNFKPAAGYSYTAGDEAKLDCQNSGYSTYWDATNGVFKLKATA